MTAPIIVCFDVLVCNRFFNGEELGNPVKYNMRSPIVPITGESYALFYGKDNYGASRGKKCDRAEQTRMKICLQHHANHLSTFICINAPNPNQLKGDLSSSDI